MCRCHGVPKIKNGLVRGVQRWRCAVKDSEYKRLRYDSDPVYRIGINLRRVISRRQPKEDGHSTLPK